MTGIHLIQFVKDGKIVKERKIEAIELNPLFSLIRHSHSALHEISEWLSTCNEGDKIVIVTELEE